MSTYLSFLEHARCPVRGFHNFLSYQRDWLDATGTGDCQGQAVLALAEVLVSPLPIGYHELARELLENVLPALAELRSLRAQAYVIQAWAQLSRGGVEDLGPLELIARHAADRLVDCFVRSQRPGWQWFESRMTYANAVLPHALFDASEKWPDEPYRTVAETSFAFLDKVTTVAGVFWPVGNRDWFSLGEEKSQYDQQPVETSTMATAALAALKQTKDPNHRTVFERARNWFHGQNSLKRSLIDVDRGACFDGLEPATVNRNQGAESTLAFLWTELLAKGLDPVDTNRSVIARPGSTMKSNGSAAVPKGPFIGPNGPPAH